MQENVLPMGESDNQLQQVSKQDSKDTKTILVPKEFDIQEVEKPSDDDFEDGGTIELEKSLEVQEKLRMRAFLTYSAVSVWLLWTLVGLINYLVAGNSLLLLTSPPVGGGLLLIVYKFYFK